MDEVMRKDGFLSPKVPRTFDQFWRNFKLRTHVEEIIPQAKYHFDQAMWVVWANSQFAAVSVLFSR